MSITNRIQELIEEKNLSKSAFAKEIGIQRSSLAHFLVVEINQAWSFSKNQEQIP